MDTNKEVKNEAVFFTGAALIGGSKLAYDIGKDVLTRFKSKEKIFVQLIDSCFLENYHLITANFANAFVHGVCIESIEIAGIDANNFKVFDKDKSEVTGFNDYTSYFGEEYIHIPIRLPPAEANGLFIRINKIEDEAILKKGGVELIIRYASIDSLEKTSEIKTNVRLRWPNEV
tara:strand:+ start:73 stop:594 length:522 start_codon:yes stop_codon:yes gene_type:complete